MKTNTQQKDKRKRTIITKAKLVASTNLSKAIVLKPIIDVYKRTLFFFDDRVSLDRFTRVIL